MKLLVFAHPGECQAFLSGASWEKINSSDFKIWRSKSEDLFLLVTGEGLDSAKSSFEKALLFLSDLNSSKPNQLINYGVAGSISENIEAGTLHFIESVTRLGVSEHGISSSLDFGDLAKHFKKHGIDLRSSTCLSSDTPVLSRAQASPLEGLSRLVDMECWALASLSERLQIPWVAFKLVSENVAHDEGFEKNFKDQSKTWSEKLFVAHKVFINNL